MNLKTGGIKQFEQADGTSYPPEILTGEPKIQWNLLCWMIGHKFRIAQGRSAINEWNETANWAWCTRCGRHADV